MFGAGEPGGIVNVVTKQPLSDPYYKIGFEVGNFGLYQPSIDLSGPLNTDETVLYRFIAAYQGSSDFQGFANRGLTTIAPSIALKLGERTNLDLYYEFSRISGYPASGLSNAVFLSDGSLTPRDFATYYPNDWTSTEFEADTVTGGEVIRFPTRNDGAFSPRVGLVYQPSEEVSLYASYTRSFFPLSGFDNTSPDEEVTFEPSRGTQYEVGVKADFLDGRLSATLAAYHLTRTNVLTPDPDDPDFSIQTGEQRSQGIELDITGEILPGWNVTAAYAYTDAEVTEDNATPVGNRLPNVPENQASLWTTYKIQAGDLEGLGFGLGLFYVGARQGDLDNSFEMGDYFRTDAALYYQRGRFNAAINMRNIFDIDAAAFAYSSTNVQRTEPFTIVGSISWEF